MGTEALIKQRTGNKSGDDLELARQIAADNPGFTATQIAWMAAGFEVDAGGYCQPAGLFSQCLAFFNAKRRISERAYDSAELAEHPRAVFRYGHAVRNPYEFGGQGIYPLDYKQPLANPGYQPAVRVAPADSQVVSKGMPDDLLAMMEDF